MSTDLYEEIKRKIAEDEASQPVTWSVLISPVLFLATIGLLAIYGDQGGGLNTGEWTIFASGIGAIFALAFIDMARYERWRSKPPTSAASLKR